MTTGKTRDEIAEAYESEPWWYEVRGFLILTFAYNSTLGVQLRFFAPHFGANHIEVACGTARFTQLCLIWRKWKKLPKVQITGIDYAPAMLAGARLRLANYPEVTLRHADAAQLPYPDNSFDTANIANSVHCFPSVDEALRDILRVLKPGGTLAANVLLYPSGFPPLRWIAQKINDWGIRKGILYSPFTEEGIRQRVLAAGYEIEHAFYSGNTWNVIARKPLQAG